MTSLIGWPVAHTVSPVLHNSLYTAMGINGIYIPLPVPSGKLEDAVKGLKAAGFLGFNVTIPYKEEILKFADELGDEVRLLGSANTIKIKDGRLIASNTDADGFVRAFTEQTGSDFRRKKVCLLGAGGTASALSVRIVLEGAESVCIINRTGSRAAELAVHINRKAAECGLAECAAAAEAGSGEALEMLEQCDIVVNTTSVGMHPDVDKNPLQQNFCLKSSQIVYDVIYNPSETMLLRQAKRCGCICANGAGMLFHQGVKAFEIWTERTVPQKILNGLSAEFMKLIAT